MRLPHGCRLLAILPLLLLPLLLPRPGQADVVFKGLSRTTEKVVRATVVLAAESCTAPDARVRRLYRRADTEIRQALDYLRLRELRTSGAKMTARTGPVVRRITIEPA